jgi:hypothetical protein
MKSLAAKRPGPGEQILVVAAALVASALAVWWSWSHAAFLLYGDAEAHIHIARRLFDSHRPGITQLGSVWLPLPHLLLVPFLAVDSWWRSGFAAVFPSAACYLLACLGLYRLLRKWISPAAAAVALAFFASNPNLLYLQTTAMNEPLFLCELVWTVLLLVEWYGRVVSDDGREGRLLWAAIIVLVAAVYTRYDGWILAFFAWVAMAVCQARRGRLLRTSFILASVVLLLAPVGWMVYNAVVFGDWLDFMRGPYSARAIELRTSSSASNPHPGWHNPWVSLIYFTKTAKMDAAALGWGGLLFLVALFGTLLAWLRRTKIPRQLTPSADRREITTLSIAWTFLLWMPLPFYVYSVSYGSVPIFIPVWPPFSWYNTRYGMELLPAFAFFAGFAVEGLLKLFRLLAPKYIWAVVAILFAALAANVAAMLHQSPLTYAEAKKNAESRSYFNSVLTEALKRLHTVDPDGVVLMNTSTFPSVVPHAGLTYRQTINESDKEFYWAALGAPATHADIVLAVAGDDIDKAVYAHPEHLLKYQTFRSPNKGWDQADATLYVSDTSPLAQLPQPSTAVTDR